jgi:hypothetical protein
LDRLNSGGPIGIVGGLQPDRRAIRLLWLPARRPVTLALSDLEAGGQLRLLLILLPPLLGRAAAPRRANVAAELPLPTPAYATRVVGLRRALGGGERGGDDEAGAGREKDEVSFDHGSSRKQPPAAAQGLVLIGIASSEPRPAVRSGPDGARRTRDQEQRAGNRSADRMKGPKWTDAPLERSVFRDTFPREKPGSDDKKVTAKTLFFSVDRRRYAAT